MEGLQIVEEGLAAGSGQSTKDLGDSGVVSGRNFAPEGAAFGGEIKDDLAAVPGMFLAADKAVADHAVEDDGDARFADEKLVDEGGLVHFAVREEIEDVELSAGEAFEKALHEEEGDEEIVGFGLAFHGRYHYIEPYDVKLS